MAQFYLSEQDRAVISQIVNAWRTGQLNLVQPQPTKLRPAIPWLAPFTLNAAFSSQEAEADLLDFDFEDTGEDITVYDRGDIFTDAENGATGWAVRIKGEWHCIQIACP